MEHALHRRHARTHFSWRQIVLWSILVVVIALLGARLYLPTYLKNYVNEKINEQKGYRGSVQDIDAALFRGAYVIKGLVLNKVDKGIPVPFVKIALSDISLQWSALFQGRIVSDIHLTRPELNFAISKSGQTSQTGVEHNWNPLIDSLVPVDINVVELINGRITFRDFSAEPPVTLFITNVDGEITNLRNVDDKKSALPSDLRISGNSIGGGKLGVTGKLNTLTKNYPDMDIDLKLENAKLPAFNDFTNACCALHFRKGDIDLYSEVAMKNGQISGYIKPLVKNLSVDRVTKDSNPFEILWSNVAAVLIEVFTNQPKDQFATKVPLSGNLEHIQTSFWPALGAIFRNAFVEAFKKGTDNEITFEKTKPKE